MSEIEVMTVLTIVVLNILLPTADTVSDIHLAVKMYRPPPACVYHLYSECLEDPVHYCSDPYNKHNCKFYESHPEMAVILLVPFLLNYIVCLYTFFRLTTERKKFLFIIPLLNLYPQFGKISVS